MKIFVASDIHGSALWCRRMLEAYEKSNAERLLLLGDILYHGPRNELPEQYAPKETLAMLNERRGSILCVRGNCDAEVDQMVLDFPLLESLGLWTNGGRLIYATHGHVFHRDALPPLQRGDILLHGHTHIPCREETEHGIWIINPGSVSLPKNNTPHACMTIDDEQICWHDLNGGVYQRLSLR
ncbi:MAG: phosphodiesterase [Oscillospiraceae bacterium]|nr:phosphodiesterase [Oscillospiraceae bacterium]